MNYEPIQPPFALNLREMSTKELRSYFQWFMEVLPQRVSQLGEYVRQTHGYEAWEPDLTPDSLNKLGDWFASQVEVRNLTAEDLKIDRERLISSIDVPSTELTNYTFSLAMDIGMYLSQVFLRNFPTLEWEQPLGNKRFVNYGQPSLKGFSNTSLNPVGIVVTLAYGLVGKTRTGNGLRQIFDIWAKLIEIPR